MYRCLAQVCFLFFLVTPIHAQISIQPNIAVNDIIQSLVGNGVEISNIIVNCNPNAYGSFRSTDNTFGLSTGIILSTGLVNDATGPNTSGSTTTDYGRSGDSQLTTISGSPTFDACVIEFDIIASGSELRFNYVFGSEEYNEYVCAQVNDIFAFFISGPGITGDQNIALIPNTNIPVSINTVNNGSIGHLAPYPSSNCNLNNAAFFTDNTAGSEVAYDGLTRQLTAVINVTPCQVYHLKLKIADGGDGKIDSGVFIENVNSNEYELSYTSNNNASHTAEGCTATLTVRRVQGLGQPATINLLYRGTATYGIDYNPLPTSLSFGINETIKTLALNPIRDDIADEGETLVFKIATNTCSGIISGDSLEIVIQEYNLGSDTTVCGGESLVLSPGNFGAESFLWQDGSTNPTFAVNRAGTYHVTVRQGSCTISDTITVNYNLPLTVDLGNDTIICSGTTLTLDATISGGTATYLWQDGSTNPRFNISQPGTYSVSVRQGNCLVSDTIEVLYVTVNLGNDTTLCMGNNLLLDATVAGAGATYLWQDGSTSPSFTVSAAGVYYVNIIRNNCSISDTVTVNYIAQPPVDLGNDTVVCPGTNITLNAVTPGGSTTYLWQDGSTDPIFSVNTPGLYHVAVGQGVCTETDSIRVSYFSFPVPTFTDTTFCFREAKKCFEDQTEKVLRLAPFAGYSGNETYAWSNGENTPFIDVDQPGIYRVSVSDNTCNESYTINVTSRCEGVICFPTAFIPDLTTGPNAIFKAVGVGIQTYELIIYNRWGEVIFHTKDLNAGWDGTFQGRSLPSGIYSYKYSSTDSNNDSKTGEGSITLIR